MNSKKILIAFILLFSFSALSSCNKQQENNPYSNLGGDFKLTDHNGKEFDLKSLRGKVVLLFFGYTICPDACPAAMTKIYTTYSMLDKKTIDQIQILFVSVDERDNPAKLKKYMSYFDMGAIGLTGTKKEVDKVVKQYGAQYRKNMNASSNIDYLIDHSTITYIIGKNGIIQYLFKEKQTSETLAKIIKVLTK